MRLYSKQCAVLLCAVLSVAVLWFALSSPRPSSAAEPVSAMPGGSSGAANRTTGRSFDVVGADSVMESGASIVASRICSFTKSISNPVLSVGPGGSWDDGDVWSPAVLAEGGGYRLWYNGDDGAGVSGIGVATSTDGISWTKDLANNPVLLPTQAWEINFIRVGSVISDGGLYKMWYGGYDSGYVGRIGYATSTNGIDWTPLPSNPVVDVGSAGSWDDATIRAPSVLKKDGTYHMWYTGSDGSTMRIGHATSTDGISWNKDLANPVLDIGQPGDWDWISVYGPSVALYNSSYLMLYSGSGLPWAWQTGYAVSTDGTNWTRGDVLLDVGGAGSFDADSADYASLIVDGNDIAVWYSGADAGLTYNIGYAAAEVCGPLANKVYLPCIMNANPSCPADYADAFSDPGSGWPISDNSSRRFAYTGGEYQIWVKNANQGWAVTPGANGTDYTVAVSARRTSGSDGAYGIEFGINADWNQFYDVLVDGEYYSIWKYNGSWSSLRGWTVSGAINTGTAWNRIKVIRSGSSIILYVNGTYVDTVYDSSLTGTRRVGLIALSPPDSALDARFDDFAFYPADCGASAADVMPMAGGPETHPVPPLPDRP